MYLAHCQAFQWERGSFVQVKKDLGQGDIELIFCLNIEAFEFRKGEEIEKEWLLYFGLKDAGFEVREANASWRTG